METINTENTNKLISMEQLQTCLTQMLKGIEDRLESTLMLCNKQATEIRGLRTTIENQDMRIKALETKLEGSLPINSATNINDSATSLNANNTTAADAVSNLRAIITEELQEKKAREEKAPNLILFNLPDANNQQGDTDQVNSLCSQINIDASKIVKIKRLGKINHAADKARPCVLTFSDIKQKYIALTKAKNIKNLPETDPKKGVIIKPDLTKIQILEDRSLFLEFRRRKQSGENVKISKGKIVNGD